MRYFSTVSLIVRVVDFTDDCAVVEHHPDGRQVMIRAIRELTDAPIAHERGFRARWCQGDLSLEVGKEQDILDAIRLDEEANGRDRIRMRVLDDFLAPVVDSEVLRERLRAALTDSDAWVRVGRGTELGYVPAGTNIDWRNRWKRDGIRLPKGMQDQDEVKSIRALRDEMPKWSHADLGTIAVCHWLPHGLRTEASRILGEKWLLGHDRAEFRLVIDDAILKMMEDIANDLDDKKWRELLVSNVLSPTVRAEALKRWRVATGATGVTSLLAGSPRMDDILVAVDLFRMAETNDDLISTLAHLLSLRAPDDDEGKEVNRRLRARCDTLGAELLPLTIAALRRALSSQASIDTVDAWLQRLSKGSQPSLPEVCRALATMEVLERSSTALTALAAARVTIEGGLTRWIQADLPNDLDLQADIVALATGDNGPAKVSRYSEAGVLARDHRKLGEWVELLSIEVVRLCREVKTLSARVDDRANAERVLGRVAAELTRDERQNLRDSAVAEADAIRRREREKVARMISESVTAVERIFEAGGEPMLASLSRRLRELAIDIGLEVQGQVGETVTVKPTVHETSAQAGTQGEVRRVGIVDNQGQLIIRPAVVPSRKVE